MKWQNKPELYQYIIVWVHAMNGCVFDSSNKYIFKNESMTVSILFVEYMIYNNTYAGISYVLCLRLHEPDVFSDVSGRGQSVIIV